MWVKYGECQLCGRRIRLRKVDNTLKYHRIKATGVNLIFGRRMACFGGQGAAKSKTVKFEWRPKCKNKKPGRN